MRFLRRYNKIILLLVFPALCLLFYNNTSNWHQHQLFSGEITSHAHPFSTPTDDPVPFQKHNHSKTEYLILDMMNHIFLLLLVSLFLIKVFISIISKPFIPHQKIPVNSDYWFVRNFRGPPSYI